jgi:hypothetical protein
MIKAFVLATALALAPMAGASVQQAIQQTDVAPELISRAEALPESAFFGGRLLQCEDKDRTARELFNSLIASIRAPLNTRFNFKNYSVSPYSDGHVYEIVIEVKVGDLGETSRSVFFLAVRNDCASASIDNPDVR